MDLELVNLTPHAIVLMHDGVSTTVPPSGTVARVQSVPGARIEIAGLPCPAFTAPTFGAVENLPAPCAGKVFIVSAMVAAQCIGRDDVVSPGTGPQDGAVRDESGRIVAVTRLILAPSK